MVVHSLDKENILDNDSQFKNERSLPDILRALNTLIRDNPRSDSKLFSYWFFNNIYCIS